MSEYVDRDITETVAGEPAFAWLVNLGMLACWIGVVVLAWQYAEGKTRFELFIYISAGMSASLVLGLLVLIWLGGIDALSRWTGNDFRRSQ